MLDQHPTELELSAAFRAYLGDAPTDADPDDLAHRLSTAYPARVRLAWTLSRTQPAIAWIVLASLVLLALVAGALMAGAWPWNRATVVAPTLDPGRWVTVAGGGASATDPRLALAAGGRVLMVEAGSGACLPRQVQGGMATWVYDPEGGALTVARPLPQLLGAEARLATLSDGRVLAAGGEADGRALSDAWVWDPDSGAWSRTGAMTVGRAGPRLMALADGRMLAAGGGINAPGFEGAFTETPTAEVYDPASGRWSVLGPLPPFGVRLVVLPDGRLLSFAVGDRHLDDEVLPLPPAANDEVVVIDLQAGTWHSLGASQLWSDRDTVLALPDGAVVNVDELGDVRRFDVSSGWRSLGRLQVARSAATIAVLADAQLLVAGGFDTTRAERTWLDTAELFDARTGTSFLVQMPVTWYGAGIRLADGSVLLAGPEPGAPEGAVCQSNVIRWVP